jgi:hypothetical protein
VQRFCEQGYLDCVRVKGPRGDQFFINRESVERYAEELKQIAATASVGGEVRHDALQRDTARNSATRRDTAPEQPKPPEPDRVADEDERASEIRRIRDENLNLRIDNRAKEQAIYFLSDQMNRKDHQLQDLSYRLGAAETRLAQLEAPKEHDDEARQMMTEPAATPVEAVIIPASAPGRSMEEPAPVAFEPEPKRSFFGRLFG